MSIDRFTYVPMILFFCIFCSAIAHRVLKDRYENSRSLAGVAGILGIIPIVSLVFIAILAMARPKK